MLTRKGQAPEGLEYVGAAILVALGIAIIFFADVQYQYSIEKAKELFLPEKSDVEALDVHFIGTDLLNTLKVKITEEKTLGEILASLPEQSSSFKEQGVIIDAVSVAAQFECTKTMQTTLDDFLEPVYGQKWGLTVLDGTTILFACTAPNALVQNPLYETQMTIPTISSEKDLAVVLEVYP